MGPLSGHCEIKITSILQDNFDLFFDIISFQHVLHFNVGRSEIEWNMKLKLEISRARATLFSYRTPVSQ